MSNKKYPTIFQPEYDREIKVLVYGEYNGANAIHLDGPHKGVKTNYFVDDELKNITREYLSNTYGKCESQEHADFICKLAENVGFYTLNDYSKNLQWFCFSDRRVEFYKENTAKSDNEKLIHLPLPPKENQMKETKPEKPIYTKEMHERGELPSVGMELLIAYKGGNTFRGTIKYISNDGFVYERENGTDSFNGSVDIVEFKPIPTIEDELSNEIANYITQPKSIDCSELADLLLTKYNITPKDQN